ncbi:IS3 family transposase [Tomitella gaofuii]|uniref:IS3 family transposase n=2 Tax=Tomitella gaofuii TaxID=2760083 RepID=UPI0015F8AB01|nr:IS3 family transposase [Tomitella gaofuii]
MIVAFIDDHKHEWGIEPICRVLTEHGCPIAPSTYYAAKQRTPSARAVRDGELTELIMEIYNDSKQVYGIRKIHAELRRRGTKVAQCTVERLCRDLGIRGVVRGKFPRRPRLAPETDRPDDRVEREFTADGLNELWVADI